MTSVLHFYYLTWFLITFIQAIITVNIL